MEAEGLELPLLRRSYIHLEVWRAIVSKGWKIVDWEWWERMVSTGPVWQISKGRNGRSCSG
jgi:hypothetical protein